MSLFEHASSVLVSVALLSATSASFGQISPEGENFGPACVAPTGTSIAGTTIVSAVEVAAETPLGHLARSRSTALSQDRSIGTRKRAAFSRARRLSFGYRLCGAEGFFSRPEVASMGSSTRR